MLLIKYLHNTQHCVTQTCVIQVCVKISIQICVIIKYVLHLQQIITRNDGQEEFYIRYSSQ